MNKKIVDTLNKIGIPIFYQETSDMLDKYIIFSIYDEKDSMYTNDINLSETYSITLNYWYKSNQDLGIYKKIKEVMKENGFIFTGAKDLKEGSYFGKNMDFFYEELL
ncbi:TPA: hypothetical protein KNH94_000153 [Clostridioides difficile]|nr:hypothetical protein [Clostridioides difficile]